MARSKNRTVSVTVDVEVDVDDLLDELDDDDLLEAVDRRFFDKDRFGTHRDIDFLADLIAEGRTREALDQLRRLCPSVQHAGAVLTFAAVRKASGATR